MPTLRPAFFATAATDSIRVPSGRIPSMPLSVFSPQAIAVAAAAESVTTLFALFVAVSVRRARWFIASSPRPVRFEKSSAIRR